MTDSSLNKCLEDNKTNLNNLCHSEVAILRHNARCQNVSSQHVRRPVLVALLRLIYSHEQQYHGKIYINNKYYIKILVTKIGAKMSSKFKYGKSALFADYEPRARFIRRISKI